jgi:hypothetical protein
MTYKFYKDSISGIYYINNDQLSTGVYEANFFSNNTIISLTNINTSRLILPPIEINQLLKEDDSPYSSIEELNDVLVGLIKTSTLSESSVGGEPINVQNPMPTDGDSVYIKDVDFANSDFTDWTGDSEQLFQSPFSTSITNSTANNPKQIVLAFSRTMNALQIGFGENNGGDFSNLKISLLGSGGTTRSIFDESTDNTKRTSRNAEFENELFNSLLIEFYTADPVSLSNITIQKARYNTTQIQGIKPNGEFSTVNTNILGNLLVSLDEQKDAFGRLKTAEPYTIFDSSLTTSVSDSLFWSELINGTASSAYDRDSSKKTLAVAASGDYLVRQTKQRFKYQPAKSHEFFITGLFNTETNIRKRAGLIDYDEIGLASITNVPQNGVFFENDGGTLSWCIANNGVITETVEQSNWNLDTLDGTGVSGFTLDVDAVNILTCQLEWLGVGVVLVGFATGGGSVVYCHAFQHASVSGFVDVYMRTANLPVAYEITATGIGSGSMKAICSSVISGGGFNPSGDTDASFNDSDIAVSSGDSELLVGLRLQEDSFEYTIEPTDLSILSLANGNTQWVLCINPTYSGTVSWANKPNSVVQEAFNNNNIVSDFGKIIAAGSFSNNNDSLDKFIDTSLKIGKDLAGNRDELWLVVTALGNENYRGTINFKQLI